MPIMEGKDFLRHADSVICHHFGMGKKPKGEGLPRLQDAIDKRDSSQSKVARACGVTPSSINDIISGRTGAISGPLLLEVCRFLRVSPYWLIKGEGKMDARIVSKADELALLDAYRDASATWKLALERVIAVPKEVQDAVAEGILTTIAQATRKPGDPTHISRESPITEGAARNVRKTKPVRKS